MAGVTVTYAGRRLRVLTDRVILNGDGGTTAEFYSMAEARSFVRYLNRLERSGAAVGSSPESDGEPSAASPAPSRPKYNRRRNVERAAELDEAWRGW